MSASGSQTLSGKAGRMGEGSLPAWRIMQLSRSKLSCREEDEKEGRGWGGGSNHTREGAELLVAKDRSQLSRAGSPPKSQPEPAPRHRDSGSPRILGAQGWNGVSRRAPAGSTWARSEAESGRAAAAVPPELVVRPQSLGCDPSLRACSRGPAGKSRLDAWQPRGFSSHIPRTGLRRSRSARRRRRRSRQCGRRDSRTVP